MLAGTSFEPFYMKLREQCCRAAFMTAAKDGHDFTFTTEDLDEFLSVVDQEVGTTEAFPVGPSIVNNAFDSQMLPQMNSTSASTSEESGLAGAERSQYALAPAPTSTGTPGSKGVCQQLMHFHIAANRTVSGDSFTAANFAAVDAPAAVDAVAARSAGAALPVAPAATPADTRSCWAGLQMSRDSYTAAVDLPSVVHGSSGSVDQQLLPTSAHSSFTTPHTHHTSTTVWDRTPRGVLPASLVQAGSGQAQVAEAHTNYAYATDSEGPHQHHAPWPTAGTYAARDVRPGQAASVHGFVEDHMPQLNTAAAVHQVPGNALQTAADAAATSAAASPSKLSTSSLPSVASVLAAARRTSPAGNSPSAAAAMTAAHTWNLAAAEDAGWANAAPGSMAPPAASSTPGTNILTPGSAVSSRSAECHLPTLSKHSSLPYSLEDPQICLQRAHSMPVSHPGTEHKTPGHWSASRTRISEQLQQYVDLPLQLFLQPQPTSQQQQEQLRRHQRHVSVDGYMSDYTRTWESEAVAPSAGFACDPPAATASLLAPPVDMQPGSGLGSNNHTAEYNTGNSSDWRTFTSVSEAPSAAPSMLNSSARLQLSHSTVEKQRRDRLNSLIDELAGMVPSADPRYGDHAVGVRRPKHVVLADTINLLKTLQAKLRADHNPPTAAGPTGVATAHQSTTAGASYLSPGAANASGVRLGPEVGSINGANLHDRPVSAAYDNPVHLGVLVERLSPGSLLVKISCKERYNLLPDVIAALKCLPVVVVGVMTAEEHGVPVRMFEVRLDNPAVTPDDVQRVLQISLFSDQRPPVKRQRYDWEC